MKLKNKINLIKGPNFFFSKMRFKINILQIKLLQKEQNQNQNQNNEDQIGSKYNIW